MPGDPRLRQAARLVALGLITNEQPSRQEDFRELLSLYATDVEFREMVATIAAGLGLRVVAVNELDVVLSPTNPDGPFAYTLGDWRQSTGQGSADDRLVHGLAVLGICAYFYPRPRDLEVERHPQATAADVDRFLRAACQEVLRSVDQAEADKEEWQLAAGIFLRQKEVVPTKDGRRASRHGTHSAIQRTFDLLKRQRMVIESPRESGIFRPLERLRLQVASIAAHEAYQALTAIRARETEP